MIADSKLVYGEDGSYIIFVPNFLDVEEYGEHTFIAHMEGTPKVLFREWMRHKDIIKGRVFYSIKEQDFFQNNSIEIEEGLYEYIDKKYR